MADLIEKEKAVRAFQGNVGIRLLRHVWAACTTIFIMMAAYLAYAVAGMNASAQTDGHIGALQVHHTVAVYRDERDFPHIRAADEHDAFFAEGFAQASDRLFQMDLVRRYIYGRLAEVLGPIQLGTDESMRELDVHDIAGREWAALPQRDRNILIAFSDGVNAAMRTQPLPVEFRLLLYQPDPWSPRDSLAVTLAMSAALGDTADNVMRRDALWHSLSTEQFDELLPLSDAAYDTPWRAARNRRPLRFPAVAWAAQHRAGIPAYGSNAWAAGGANTSTGRALIANDPHLSVGIPDIWYAVEIRSPHLHVAGVTIPGIPGVVLGHNDRIAWASTNGVVTTLSVFRPGSMSPQGWKGEVFHVRFGRDVVKHYYRTAREVLQDTSQGSALVRWTPYYDNRSAIQTVLRLDRAGSISEAMRALSSYVGPPQNFVVADAHGRVAYHLAGPIPHDPAWGRYVHSATERVRTFARIPFAKLPSIEPSRTALVVTANNKMYGKGYPYRLSAMFAPPYRAYRIADLLRARSTYDVAYFTQMQLDATSPADAEFAHRVAAWERTHPGLLPPNAVDLLSRWDGSYSADSRAATIEHALRVEIENESVSPYAAFEAARRPQSSAYLNAVRDIARDAEEMPPWGRAGAVDVFHPFGPIGFPFLNGSRFPGNGDEYTIRVQTTALSQSFRAVWEAGAWESGGLSLPTGESGEIGSRHYDDLSSDWVRGTLRPLPFSDDAVRRAARRTLLLEQ